MLGFHSVWLRRSSWHHVWCGSTRSRSTMCWMGTWTSLWSAWAGPYLNGCLDHLTRDSGQLGKMADGHAIPDVRPPPANCPTSTRSRERTSIQFPLFVRRAARLTRERHRATPPRRRATRDHRVRPRSTRTVPRRVYIRRRTSADRPPTPSRDCRIASRRHCQRSSEHVSESPPPIAPPRHGAMLSD